MFRPRVINRSEKGLEKKIKELDLLYNNDEIITKIYNQYYSLYNNAANKMQSTSQLHTIRKAYLAELKIRKEAFLLYRKKVLDLIKDEGITHKSNVDPSNMMELFTAAMEDGDVYELGFSNTDDCIESFDWVSEISMMCNNKRTWEDFLSRACNYFRVNTHLRMLDFLLSEIFEKDYPDTLRLSGDLTSGEMMQLFGIAHINKEKFTERKDHHWPHILKATKKVIGDNPLKNFTTAKGNANSRLYNAVYRRYEYVALSTMKKWLNKDLQKEYTESDIKKLTKA